MANTLFAYLKGAISDANDTDPEQSSSFYNPPMEAHHNVISYRRETLYLDEGDTRAVTFPDSSAASGWVGIMARVVGTEPYAFGHAKLTTVGVNWDGSSALTGITAGYGMSRHPGMISLVTQNVTGFTFEGLADGTEVQYVSMILAEDDQL